MSAFGDDLPELAPPPQAPPPPPPPLPEKKPPAAAPAKKAAADDLFVYVVTLRGSPPVLHTSALEPPKLGRAIADARKTRRAFEWDDGGFSLAEDVTDVRPITEDEVKEFEAAQKGGG